MTYELIRVCVALEVFLPITYVGQEKDINNNVMRAVGKGDVIVKIYHCNLTLRNVLHVREMEGSFMSFYIFFLFYISQRLCEYTRMEKKC